MHQNTRRKFMSNVGRGMLIAGLGSTLATDLGLHGDSAPNRRWNYRFAVSGN
ncbi:MAG: hypothetical protein JNK74_27715 [Candidatus Hydrogenedentes bacterium]|nr:hypothetical protein [Candidatus Hydrogenedentota bacterium]